MIAAQERQTPSLPQRGPERSTKPRRKPAKRLAQVSRLKACSLLLLGFLLCTTLVYCQAQIALVGFRLQALEKSIDRLRAENQLLETNLESLVAPDRLEAIAKKQLGMVYPSSAAGEIVLPPANQVEAAKQEENKGRRGWLEELLQFLAAHLGQRGA
ncbi:septum formation initiator family protein [Ammonifex thiophilus]|uniref:Cell division protein FtsL n=1 Tax=Ammonifex thiophilus TaxID=444093 RepID=A0A3D8P513_9THEO|nr:septum formation initiator family protein [Ammonifex thiophilus]RDV82896.1 hypothetical protein DXX99_06755 [Ammonifex thiophilus]